MTPGQPRPCQVAGVVGSPIGHSLSPLIHNAWIRASGIDAVYVALQATAETFPGMVRGLRQGGVRGLNVTAPFKEAALAGADTATSRATRAGSANLLLFDGHGRIHADNTDGVGLLNAFTLQADGFQPSAGPVIILGSGGAARGVGAAILDAGAPAVTFVVRSVEKAQPLTDLLGRAASICAYERFDRIAGHANAVINATPVGSAGRADEFALSLDELPDGCVVMDMVYRPLRTRLLERAAARNLRTVDGMAMLVGQAIPSFEAMFGRRPPDVDVRQLALAVLEEVH